jgi:hypothetical protein
VLELRIPQLAIGEMLVELEQRGGGLFAVCAAGHARRGQDIALIHRSVGSYTTGLAEATAAVTAAGFRPVIIGFAPRAPEVAAVARLMQALGASGAEVGAAVLLVEQRGEIAAYGGGLVSGQTCAVGQLCLPGPGMVKLNVRPFGSEPPGERSTETTEGQTPWSSATGGGRGSGRWSREAGAIGSGDRGRGYALLDRVAGLQATLIGCGRLGESVAWRLAQDGFCRLGSLVLVDSDVVQDHNLGIILPEQAVGMPKAEAVAALLRAIAPHCRAVPLVATLSDQSAADAAAWSDLIITCVDEDAPRLGAAVLASRYGALHLDLAGGVAHTASGGVAIGGEVRLSLPWGRGCLGCALEWNWPGVVGVLSESAARERERRERVVWEGQRAGSWPDVLLPVVGEGVQEIFRVLQGRRRGSVWRHYYVDENGDPHFEDWSRRWRGRVQSCYVCSEHGVRGRGDP